MLLKIVPFEFVFPEKNVWNSYHVFQISRIQFLLSKISYLETVSS